MSSARPATTSSRSSRPFQQGTSAGRYIERRKGDGGYMVIIQVDDAQAERKRVTDLGIRAVAQKDLPE